MGPVRLSSREAALRLLSLFLVLSFACILAARPAFAQTSEYKVKAGFVLNFIRFTVYSKKYREINLCVLGSDEVQTEFAALEGRSVSGAKLKIIKNAESSQPENCQAMFLAGEHADSAEGALEPYRGTSVLTIGEEAGFTRSGGIIRLYKESSKVRFEINTDAAKRANLSFSSRLLRLATVYKE